MSRPPLEVADVIRAVGPAFLDRARRYFDRQHWKALNAILRCRSAALGGHLDECSSCGKRVLSYNSCRNRHCPRCQANARHRWLEARRADLLPTRYVHVVFTLPHELAPLALVNQKVVYTLLFRLSAETLLEFARDPRLLGAEIGFFSVLHTWNQKLQHHPHVHCVVPEGGMAADGSRWVRPRRTLFLPVKAMAKAFRGKFRDALEQAFAAGQLQFPGQMRNLAAPRAFAELMRKCFRKKWVIYAKRPFGGPEHVLEYLGNYTHRIAISNHRLLTLEDGKVSFRWRDSAHNNQQRVMTLPAEEFLRRFFLHVLPAGFVRIRYFGLFANRLRTVALDTCRGLLAQAGAPPTAPTMNAHPVTSFWSCPDCGGAMVLIERLTPAQIYTRPPPLAEIPA
jgi:predicted RNA-binding Zn-ribbon protein involved in translation (DUF1610 family)